jgi:hypothetical protein
MEDASDAARRRWSRRNALALGLSTIGALAVAGVAGIELVDHGVLPGKSILDELDGACDVPFAGFDIGDVGAVVSGAFSSRYRRCTVGYSVGFPGGHAKGSELPLVVFLHGEGGTHRTALCGVTPAQAVSLRVDGVQLEPMALVTVDGGRGYWHPHPGDDPMGMVVHELIPMLRGWGLGRTPGSIGTSGISMGGYGAVLFAECHPELFGAVAAISPAIWTSYAQASGANANAYNDASQFARYDAVTHAGALAHCPVRVAAGTSDPFYPGDLALAARLGHAAEVDFAGGCHTSAFFIAQEPPSMAFLAQHLAR